MDNNAKELKLTDLLDVNTLQRLQDAFSDLTGMAALTADKDGTAVTDGSNFTDFCMKLTRPTEIGRKRCEKCDRKGAEIALANGRSCSYKCHAGLVDFAAPIMANGEMVGSFIGGQILTEPPDIEKFEKIAEEIGADPEEYKKAIQKVKIVSQETINRASNFLYVISMVLSSIAYKSYALNKSKLEIEKASGMKSDFLANMSHEIRTPMNAVIGLADMALREEMSPAAREYIHQVKASSKNLLVIINDILDFSKIESGKLDIVEVEYEPLSLINDLTSIVNSRIGGKDIEFIMDISPDLPQELYGDNVRIHQIILNLLTNAVKFTQQGEVRLKIECLPDGDDKITMNVEVSDTGIGIKKKDIEKLFNSFQQVDSKRNRNIEGTGLGLAISQQLLNLMHGKISVQSEYEKGSTFFFELPQRVINSAPSIPKLEKPSLAALLISNRYVKNQLMRDLERIGAEYADLSEKGSFSDMQIDYLIVDKLFFTQTIKNYLEKNPAVPCLLLTDYDNIEPVDIPNVRVISKPVYSLGLYNAMGITDIAVTSSDDGESETFTFVAPEAHILVVDDNSVNLTVARGLLEPLDMEVDTAASAAEAIDKIHYVKYDLIFMDHMMPEVDGVEATHIIRRLVPSYNNVPIIALTANAVGGAREMFIEEGMNDFVAKPIEIKDIVSKLRKWLPKEKIIPVDKNAAPNDSAPNGNENPAEQPANNIVNIKQLNTKQALSLLGSEKLFRAVLKEYYCAIDKKSALIQKHKDEERWRDYTIEVHSLKSTSKQIGSNLVSTLAAEMEKAGNEGNIELINQKHDEMMTEYLKYKDILKPYFPECSEQQTGEPQSGGVLELLEQMQVALDNFDILQIDEAVEKISNADVPDAQNEYCEKLKRAAENSDIDLCKSIIEEWGHSIISANGNNSAENVLQMLDKMQIALDAFDILEIDEVIESMEKQGYLGEQRERFDKLREAAENSDLEACGAIIEEWRNAVTA